MFRKLRNENSKVSSHYFIKKNGEIISLVPDLYVAWHAGISSWKNVKFLNKYSIGIEISNPGHNYQYVNFTKKQINSVLKLSKFLKKNQSTAIILGSILGPIFYFISPEWCILFGGVVAGSIAFLIGEKDVF